MMQADLKELKDEIAHVLKRHDVQRAAFFGSFATGEAKEHSDVDILIEFTGTKSLLDLVALKIEIEEALQRKVDVLTYDSLAPAIRERVLREQVAII
jgi:predicted nucleotidyltransferase